MGSQFKCSPTLALIGFVSTLIFTHPPRLAAQSLGGIVQQVSLDKVPPLSITSAQAVSGAKFGTARLEIQDDGSLLYVLRGNNQQGYTVEVKATPQGTLVQIDEQIDPSAAPEVATKAFKKWSGEERPLSVWRSTRLGQTYYQYVIPDFWLEISPDADKVVIFKQKIKY